METSKVESGTEFITDRDETVLNTNAGTLVFGSTTGREKVHISHKSGSNLNITNQYTSELATNDKQLLVLGNQYSTTQGNSYTTSGSNKEDRVKGDLTVIVGSDKLLSTPLANNWLDKYSQLAAAKTQPAWNYCAIGNNTGTVYPEGGTPDPDSGAAEGGSYQQHENIVPQLTEELVGELAEIESEMGVGGSLRFMTGKHIFLQAGTAATVFDSGTMSPNKKAVTRNWKVVDGKLVEEKTSTSRYESVDTSNAIPFGDIHISAGTKLNMSSGSGGINMNTAGEANLTAQGGLIIGGAAVAIGGSDNNNAGRVEVKADCDVFVKSGDLMHMQAKDRIDETTCQHSFCNALALFTGNLEVYGDLVVHGCILAHGDITAGGPGGVSLLNHKHSGVCAGSSNTGGPV